MTEGKWLLLCQRHSKIQQAAESIAGQRPVSSLCPSALGPPKVGAGASPQNAFGCQRQAKRSACPTRGWVKPRSPAVQVLAAQALSALRGRFGIILLLIPSPGSEPRASETSSTKARTVAQIRPVLAGRGRETTPSQHRITQRPTGGHEGFSCFCRSFATRWRSVASASSASWLA